MGHRPGIYRSLKVANIMSWNFPNVIPHKWNREPEALTHMAESFANDSMIVDEHGVLRLVVYADGASYHNREGKQQGGVGVHFGMRHYCNFSGPLHGHVHTIQRAELAAIYQALRIIYYREDKYRWELRTTSQYVYTTLTVRAPEWERNGWKDERGRDIEHLDFIRSIHIFLNIAKSPTRGNYFVLKLVGWTEEEEGSWQANELARKGLERAIWSLPTKMDNW